MSASQNNFNDIADLTLNLAKKDKVEVEISISESETFSAKFENRKMGKYQSNQSQALEIRVINGLGLGYVRSENVSPNSVQSVYQEALFQSQNIKKKEPFRLYKPTQKSQELNLFFEETFNQSIDKKIKNAQLLESAALDESPLITKVPYSSYSDGWGESVYFNSLGTKLNFKQSHLSGYTYANIKTDKGEIIQGEGFFGRKPEGFNPSKIGQNVARKLLNRQKTAEVKSGSYNVIFTGEMVSQLLSGLGYHISLKKIDEKTSLFDLNDLNGTSDKTKFSPLFNLVDKPLDETLPGARHCDDDGFATKNQSFFEKGRLVQFMSNQDLAEKYKLNNTANCYKSGIEKSILAHNFVMSKGDTTEVQMNRLFIDCLVIDDIQGIHAGYKESTLDFSLPASAFVMKNGEPQGYAQQFLISGNVLELLKNIVAVADHYPEAVSSFYCPSIGVENVRIAAK